VYPWNAHPAGRRVSIMSPLGIQLLGAMPGHIFRIEGSCFSIAYVTYQPEAEQHFHL
jgi:transcription elongation GreA/GreB family factor